MALPLERFSPFRRENKLPSQAATVQQVLVKEGGKHPSFDPILPWSIRYALQYKEGLLNKNDLTTLTNGNFVDSTVYLVTKALDDNKTGQKEFLETFIDTATSSDSSPDYQTSLKETIYHLPDDIHIPGNKLAQVSRQGFLNWDERFRKLASDVYLPDSSDVPVMLAYASMLGLRHVVEEGKQSEKPLLILSPKWILDESVGQCGYQINFKAEKGSRVQDLHKDFIRPTHAVLIDDTRNTGRHMEEIARFWNSSSSEEITQEGARVVCEVRHSRSPRPIPVFSAV